MCAIGPKRTFLFAAHMTAFGGKGDMATIRDAKLTTLSDSGQRTLPTMHVRCQNAANA